MQTYVRRIHTLDFSNISKYNEIQLKIHKRYTKKTNMHAKIFFTLYGNDDVFGSKYVFLVSLIMC